MDHIDYKQIGQVIRDFTAHVDYIDPYRARAGRMDRVIRAVIVAYDHDVRRTESATEREQLSALEKAYRIYKADDSIINLYNVISAYNILTWYNPCVSYRWAIDVIYDMDHNR